uniref:Uncharacterized protein n=1 Tax=Romanomermis culicivorax TaxID=13658 RepID=A0A915IDN5_ROMCU
MRKACHTRKALKGRDEISKNIFCFSAHSFIFASNPFRKQLNRVVFLFASKRAIFFCVVNVQATIDHPLYYPCYPALCPVLTAITSNWIK